MALVKGDRVEIVIDTGDGARTYEVSAAKAGRRVELTTGRTVVEVTEVTRTGNPVRTARFMASRVLALVEHPATEAPAGEGTAGEPLASGASESARLRALEQRMPEPDW
jgi:hypothetical protein